MPIQKPDYQLSFDLDLPEETGDSAIQRLSADEIRLRSETARQVFEGRGDLKWMEEYSRLRDGGWDWRVAAYIAWASSPKIEPARNPRTQDELAQQHLGLTSDRAIATWRKKNPAIDEMVALMQSGGTWEERADQFNALNEGARKSKDDYKFFPYLKMAMEMRNDYIPTAKLDAMLKKGSITKNDLADMSEEELAVTKARLQDMLKSIDSGGEDE